MYRIILTILLSMGLTVGVANAQEDILDIDSMFLDDMDGGEEEVTSEAVVATEEAQEPPEDLLSAIEDETVNQEVNDGNQDDISDEMLIKALTQEAYDPEALGMFPEQIDEESITPLLEGKETPQDIAVEQLIPSGVNVSSEDVAQEEILDTVEEEVGDPLDSVMEGQEATVMDDLLPNDTLETMPMETQGATEAMVLYPNDMGATEEWTGSLMFSSEELQRIEEAIAFSEKPPEEQQDIILSNEAPQETINPVAQLAPPPPNYFLNSIMYFSDANWSIWLNGKKLSGNDATERVQISQIEPEAVKLTWKASAIDEQVPGWRDILKNVEGTVYISDDKSITYDMVSKELSFILRPNQRFIGKDLAILEGSGEEKTHSSGVSSLQMGQGIGVMNNQQAGINALPPGFAEDMQSSFNQNSGARRTLEQIAEDGMQDFEKLNRLGNMVNSIEQQP